MEGIPNIKIVKVTSWLAIPANMQGEDVVGTEWAKVLAVTSEDILNPAVITEATHIDEPVLVEETTMKEEKPKKKTNTSKSTKKAMSALKKNKKAYTGAVYGWDVKQGSLVPNWKEQNNIEWMKVQLKYDVAGAVIAKTLNENGLTGKKGGKWTSTSVLRTIRNELHSTRNDDEAPRWFKKRGGKGLKN